MYFDTSSSFHVQLLLLFFPLLVVGDFDSATCCQKAAFMNAFVNPAPNISCGQLYEPSKPPAPPAIINYIFCTQNCGGWDHSEALNPKKWAAPIVQFILPALIFSMNIPRRLAFLPKRRPKIPQLQPQRYENWCTRMSKHVGAQLLSVYILAVVVVDTLCWVFIILGLASPMMMSGLQEELLGSKALDLVLEQDYSTPVPSTADQPEQQSSDEEGLERSLIKHQVSDPDDPEQGLQRISHEDALDLAQTEKQLSDEVGLKLVVAVVSGNLLVSKVVNPREAIIEELLTYTPTWDVRKQRLLSLMAAQSSFGGTIGVPVVFYLGSFVYTILDLQSNPSDRDTAISLAFGVEWMIIVHVAIISGCLLASNNPSTSVGLISHRKLDSAPPHNPFFLQPVYDLCFQPVNMWRRGANKDEWLKAIAPSFQEQLTISRWEWTVYVLVPTFVLVSVPPASAAFVAWRSPPIGWGCRSLSFICYGALQTIVMFIFFIDRMIGNVSATTWRRISLRIGYGLFGFLSLFTSVGSTIMQVTGVFENCICQVNANEWLNLMNSTVNVAMDTQEQRDSSGSWIRIGIAATGFMAMCAYLGWWYQKAIREKYELAVARLPREIDL